VSDLFATRVALTFDAEHPSRSGTRPGAAEDILDALDRAGAPGTFFIQGRWASAYPALARRMAAGGHLIGNHSHYHARLTLLTSAGLRRDVEQAEGRISEVTGSDPRPWFRCPFGDGEDRPEVLDALRALGYRNVGWNVDSEDWCESSSPESVRSAVAQGAGAARREPSVVLFHTWSAATADSLTAIIEGLRAGGASLVTVAGAVR
jgi:peptidoglycan/xylan/chitin deacetylase (PgdA/CDA1 family)